MSKNMEHSAQIAEWISGNVLAKFEAGVDEHGGELRRKPVSGHLREELVDALVYLAVSEEQEYTEWVLLEIAEELVGVDDALALKCIRGVLNIKRTGNVYGIMEVELSGEPNKTLSFSDTERYFADKEIYEYILGDKNDRS